jgi:hypothetical protein
VGGGAPARDGRDSTREKKQIMLGRKRGGRGERMRIEKACRHWSGVHENGCGEEQGVELVRDAGVSEEELAADEGEES